MTESPHFQDFEAELVPDTEPIRIPLSSDEDGAGETVQSR